MSGLTVKAVDGETEKLGVKVNTLQDNIVIADDAITGTLKHVEEFIQFSNEPSEQSGNFLALSLEDEDGEIETELENGTKGPVKVDDGFCIYRITDNETQKIKVTVTKGDISGIKTYDLSGLTCEEE